MNWITDHPLYLLLALATMLSAGWLIKNRERLQIKTWVAVLLAVLHTLVGVVFVKFFAFLEGADSGATSLFGGVFFMPLLYLLGAKVFKRKAAIVCDVFTPCMIVTLMCARVNCILSGCCMGKEIPFITDKTLRWPTRELELLFYLILLAVIIPDSLPSRSQKERVQRLPTGILYPLYMAAYGVFRFVIEFFRTSGSPSIFHIAHLWAVLSLCIGFAVYGEIKGKRKKKMGKKAVRK